jgi:hypothetical protein
MDETLSPIPDQSTRWQLWASDTFDQDSVPGMQTSGEGLLAGLYQLWLHTLSESILENGHATFTRFHLTWGEGTRARVEVDVKPFDNHTLAKLRLWVDHFEDISRMAALIGLELQQEGPNPVLQRLASELWERVRTGQRWQAQAIAWNSEAKELLNSLESMPLNFFLLDADQRRLVHIMLSENALDIWNGFIQAQAQIEYVESVVGTHQVLDPFLPQEAFQAASRGERSEEIAKRYREPITALQDDDLEFPEHITFAYFAIYNLFRKYSLAEPVEDWLIVNQALSALADPEKRKG